MPKKNTEESTPKVGHDNRVTATALHTLRAVIGPITHGNGYLVA
jgi:hypothetical protein